MWSENVLCEWILLNLMTHTVPNFLYKPIFIIVLNPHSNVLYPSFFGFFGISYQKNVLKSWFMVENLFYLSLKCQFCSHILKLSWIRDVGTGWKLHLPRRNLSHTFCSKVHFVIFLVTILVGVYLFPSFLFYFFTF